MQTAESLNLMQDLFASYEKGVQGIAPVFSVAALFLGENFEREADKSRLRENLARNGNLRKKDFDQMLDGLVDARQNSAQETHRLLLDYIRSQQETINQLGGYFAEARQYMADGDFARIKLTLVQIKKTIARQEQNRRELENELVEFEKERNEINSGIKCLLQKGRELQVRDFKEMLARIKRQRKGRIEENRLRRETVGRMLADFKQQRTNCADVRG